MKDHPILKKLVSLLDLTLENIELLLTEDKMDIVINRPFFSKRAGKIIAAILFAVGAFLASTGFGGSKAMLLADVLFRYGTVLWRV